MALGFLLLEDLKHEFLLDFRDLVDLLDHAVEDVHDNIGKIRNACRIIKR